MWGTGDPHRSGFPRVPGTATLMLVGLDTVRRHDLDTARPAKITVDNGPIRQHRPRGPGPGSRTTTSSDSGSDAPARPHRNLPTGSAGAGVAGLWPLDGPARVGPKSQALRSATKSCRHSPVSGFRGTQKGRESHEAYRDCIAYGDDLGNWLYNVDHSYRLRHLLEGPQVEYVNRLVFEEDLSYFLNSKRGKVATELNMFDWSDDGCSGGWAKNAADVAHLPVATNVFHNQCLRHDFGYRNYALLERRWDKNYSTRWKKYRVDTQLLFDMGIECGRLYSGGGWLAWLHALF